MTSHKKMITYLWSFSFGFFTNHNIWSFLNNTSHFEIGDWNFWYFNIENKPLAFWTSYLSIRPLSLFPSQILVCAMTFAAHFLFSRFDICWVIKQKHEKCGKIYRHKSIHVSKPLRLLTNHSWQASRSIYNSHT